MNDRKAQLRAALERAADIAAAALRELDAPVPPWWDAADEEERLDWARRKAEQAIEALRQACK